MNYYFLTKILLLAFITFTIEIMQYASNIIQRNIEMERNRLSIRRQFKPPNRYDSNNIRYTKDLIDFVRDFTAQVAVIKFSQYKNGHKLEKVTRENLIPLISDIATYVKESIDFDHIDFDKLVCNSKFVEKYIIDTTVLLLDDMLVKEVQKQLYED